MNYNINIHVLTEYELIALSQYVHQLRSLMILVFNSYNLQRKQIKIKKDILIIKRNPSYL